jgi:hypothetical protein
LGDRGTLLGGPVQPFVGFTVIPLQAEASNIKQAQTRLGFGISLAGRHADPFSSLGIFTRSFCTFQTSFAKSVLGCSVAAERPSFQRCAVPAPVTKAGNYQDGEK